MARDVKFIILNGDDAFGVEARDLLLRLDGVKIVAEVDEAALLGQAVKQFPVDIVLANLDPSPESLLPLIGLFQPNACSCPGEPMLEVSPDASLMRTLLIKPGDRSEKV